MNPNEDPGCLPEIDTTADVPRFDTEADYNDDDLCSCSEEMSTNTYRVGDIYKDYKSLTPVSGKNDDSLFWSDFYPDEDVRSDELLFVVVNKFNGHEFEPGTIVKRTGCSLSSFANEHDWWSFSTNEVALLPHQGVETLCNGKSPRLTDEDYKKTNETAEEKPTKDEFASWNTCLNCGEKVFGSQGITEWGKWGEHLIGATVTGGTCPDCGDEPVVLYPIRDFRRFTNDKEVTEIKDTIDDDSFLDNIPDNVIAASEFQLYDKDMEGKIKITVENEYGEYSIKVPYDGGAADVANAFHDVMKCMGFHGDTAEEFIPYSDI